MLKSCLSTEPSSVVGSVESEERSIYRCRNYGVIREGYAFSVVGTMEPDGDRLIIDFLANDTNNDIVLRAVFCASASSLSRNSCLNGEWSLKETTLENRFYLVKSREFEVEVFFTNENIFFAFDGVHIANYIHQKCFVGIQIIELRGQVKLLRTAFNFMAEYPSRIRNSIYLNRRYANEGSGFLPVPHYATFFQGFFRENYSIIVKGNVRPNPKMIKIAIQAGQRIWPVPCIVIQLEVRFDNNFSTGTDKIAVTFSSFPTGQWVGEYITRVISGLVPGLDFNLRIMRSRSFFGVYLNNNYIHYYPCHLVVDRMNTCLVEGDIHLTDTVIDID